MTDQRDQIFASRGAPPGVFCFDEQVARVFPDMIRRSVPGYSAVIGMTGVIAAQYAQPGSRCYDLGSSLGAGALAMAGAINAEGVRVIGVDNSPAMLDRCRDSLRDATTRCPIQFICADLREVVLDDPSVVVMNYTLQFIPAGQRDDLIGHIYEALRPGGALLLSEKITDDDPERAARLVELHHAFKRANGYSELEIAQKRSALENVLIPESLPTHQQRLQTAGFGSVDLWFQYFNFVSLVAVK